jgi:hypothetical protein
MNSVGTLLDAKDFSRDASAFTDMIKRLREGDALRLKGRAKQERAENQQPRRFSESIQGKPILVAWLDRAGCPSEKIVGNSQGGNRLARQRRVNTGDFRDANSLRLKMLV